jgi:hypothetical protein
MVASPMSRSRRARTVWTVNGRPALAISADPGAAANIVW